MLNFPEINGQTRLPKPEQHSLLPIFPAPWLRLLQRLDTLVTLCGGELFFTTPSPAKFLWLHRRNRLIRCELSRLCCHGHSLLLSSYLCRIHLLLDYPASEPLQRGGTTSSIFDLWSRPWVLPNCWVSVEFLHAPILRKWSGSNTTTIQV